MSTVAKLLARKERLLEQLETDPGPNEREEIQRLLAQIETALSLLEPGDATRRVIRARIGSQGAEIVRHLAELLDELGVTEVAAGQGMPSAGGHESVTLSDRGRSGPLAQ